MLRGVEQLAEWIEVEFNSFLLKQIELPMGTLATVVGVRLTNDKQHAYLQVSILPINKIGTAKAVLLKALPRARAYLSKRTNRHRVPALHLEISDDALKDRLIERKLEDIQ